MRIGFKHRTEHRNFTLSLWIPGTAPLNRIFYSLGKFGFDIMQMQTAIVQEEGWRGSYPEAGRLAFRSSCGRGPACRETSAAEHLDCGLRRNDEALQMLCQ